MSFWSRNIANWHVASSGWSASHIADPKPSLTLDAYRESSGDYFSNPVPLDRFIEYGLWYQRQSVPCLHPRGLVGIHCIMVDANYLALIEGTD